MAKRNSDSRSQTRVQTIAGQPSEAIVGRADGFSRRGFLAGAASAGAGIAAAGVLGFPSTAEAQAAGPSVADVLNFALNLEYLEASFYATIIGATPPDPNVTGNPWAANPVTDPLTLSYATALYNDEMAHIKLLIATIQSLGGVPIDPPTIDLSAGGKIAISAATATAPATDPTALFLSVARQFEAVGASAYAGAAQYVVSQGAVLTAAAQILGAESQHLGALNSLCVNSPFQSTTSSGINYTGVPNSAPYGTAVDSLDHPPTPYIPAGTDSSGKAIAAVPPNFFTIAPTSLTISAASPGSALGPQRSPSQVLGIVYGSSSSSTNLATAGVIKGGFFPNGVNGTIVST